MMKNTVKHVFEPPRLLLAWQAPEGLNRTRFIVGELNRKGDRISFRYNLDSEDYKEAKNLGFSGYPAFKRHDTEYTEGVMETFMRRLPPKSRGDFSKYLDMYRLPTNQKISDFALLGYSGARLPTDGFSIINPFDTLSEPTEFLLEVAGFRHMSHLSLDDLNIGDPVAIKLDNDNKYDSNAVKIEYKGKLAGYVCRGLARTFKKWLLEKYKITATIERVNGHPVRPLVYVFVRVIPKGSKK